MLRWASYGDYAVLHEISFTFFYFTIKKKKLKFPSINISSLVSGGAREIVHSQSAGGMRAYPNSRDKVHCTISFQFSFRVVIRGAIKDKPHWGKVLVKKYSEAFKENPSDILDEMLQLPFVGPNCLIEGNSVIFMEAEIEQKKEEEEEEETDYPSLPCNS
uniref:Uncharacterized protein n=1 Tax=Amphimedon queenslandica TaxID=400682 RepID=A0A1X7TT44_AMPQE